MATHADDIADIVIGVQRDLGKHRLSQIAQFQTDYEVLPKWFKKDRVSLGGSRGVRRTLFHKTQGAAEHLGLFSESTVKIGDQYAELVLPWVHARTHWGYERREVLMSTGDALINDVVKTRRAAAMIDMIEKVETRAWTAPDVGDVINPRGIPWWIVQSATAGFNGGLSGSWTTVGGIDLDVVDTFKNYTFGYAAITKDDLIKKWRTAKRLTKFVSPVSLKEYRGPKGEMYRHYCNEATISALEDLGEQQNENLGNDLAPMDGKMAFKGNPVIYIPELDTKANNPIYSIDHTTFHPYILKGDYLHETDPKNTRDDPDTYAIFISLTYQYVCVDRRRNSVTYDTTV